MPKDTKTKKTTNYYGCVYGGVMKQGYVYFFQTTEDPDEYFAQFKDYYGSKVRGRFVKVSDDEEYMEKIQDKLSEQQVHGKLYEVSVDTASKTLKELTGAKKASLLGDDETQAADDGAKSEAEDTPAKETKESKKVKVQAKPSKKEEAEESEKKSAKSKKQTKKVESESEDEEPSEAESEEESEEEEEAPPKKSSKAKEPPAKDTKKKESGKTAKSSK